LVANAQYLLTLSIKFERYIYAFFA